MPLSAVSDGDLHKVIDLLTVIIGYCDLARLASTRIIPTPRQERAFRNLVHDLDRCKSATDDLVVLLTGLGFLS